jgi:hypothetical protein
MPCDVNHFVPKKMHLWGKNGFPTAQVRKSYHWQAAQLGEGPISVSIYATSKAGMHIVFERMDKVLKKCIIGCWISQVEDSDASLGDSCENMLPGSSKKVTWKDGYLER